MTFGYTPSLQVNPNFLLMFCVCCFRQVFCFSIFLVSHLVILIYEMKFPTKMVKPLNFCVWNQIVELPLLWSIFMQIYNIRASLNKKKFETNSGPGPLYICGALKRAHWYCLSLPILSYNKSEIFHQESKINFYFYLLKIFITN